MSTPSSSSSSRSAGGGRVSESMLAANLLAPSSCSCTEVEKILDGVTTPVHSSGVDDPEDAGELSDDADDDADDAVACIGRGTTKPCVANPFLSA